MKSGAQLKLRGVRPEAIETAREAARRSGQPLAEWIGSAILGTAAESGVRPRSRPAREATDHADNTYGDIHERLDQIAGRLDRMMKGGGSSAAHETDSSSSMHELETRLAAMARDLSPRSDATPRRLSDAIARLDKRLNQLLAKPEPRTADPRATAIEQALYSVNREMAKPAPVAREPSFNLDDAVAEIAARQRALEGEPVDVEPEIVPEPAYAPEPEPKAPDMSGLESLLHTITGQLETLRQPSTVEDSVALLRRELAEVSHTLTEAMPRQELESLHAEVRELGARIDRVARPADDNAALAGIERSLAEVREAVGALWEAESRGAADNGVQELARKVDQIAASGPDMEHLETAIAELRNISTRVASGDALAALASDVRQMGAKLDRVSAPAPVDHESIDYLAQRVEALAAMLEARDAAPAPPAADHEAIDYLAQRIEALASMLETRDMAPPPAPDTSRIESLVRSLSDKIEAMGTAPGGHFDQLEDQILRLARKLDATEAQLGNLGAIEHAIGDLVEQMHQARASAVRAAEDAARAAAREMIGEASGADVDALKHELAQFRATQAEIDSRSHDMFEAVRETLERLVERLAALESETHSRATPAPAPFGAPPAAAAANRQVQAPPPAVRFTPPAPERRPIEPSLPADHPLEPGTGAPRGRPATAAERIAASEAALGSVKPAAAAEPSGKANFIAAARRAAQAAAADASGDTARRQDDKAARSMFGAIGGMISKRRRPLMIAVGVLLLAIGTLQLMSTMFTSPEPPRVAPRPPVVEQKISPSEIAKPPVIQPNGSSSTAEPAPPADAPPAPERRSDIAPPKTETVAGADNSSMLPGTGSALPTLPNLPMYPSAKPGDLTGAAGPLSISTVAPPAGAIVTPKHQDSVDGLPASIGPSALRSAALAGNPGAEYEIGIRYAEGRGVSASTEEGIRWLERAADHGLAPAQYRLGSLYEKGQGVKKDLEKARRLYTTAADKGNGKAMHNLAVLYAEGIDGKPDFNQASHWFRKAADRGVADSQYNLGILYARGIGVEQNLAESYKWFALAALQGDQDAGKKRDDVAGKLDAQSLSAARLAVQTWSAEPQPDEAVNVKAPAGGWDKAAAPAAKPVKPSLAPPRKLKPV